MEHGEGYCSTTTRLYYLDQLKLIRTVILTTVTPHPNQTDRLTPTFPLDFQIYERYTLWRLSTKSWNRDTDKTRPIKQHSLPIHVTSYKSSQGPMYSHMMYGHLEEGSDPVGLSRRPLFQKESTLGNKLKSGHTQENEESYKVIEVQNSESF